MVRKELERFISQRTTVVMPVTSEKDGQRVKCAVWDILT